jgi:hypothetical protein
MISAGDKLVTAACGVAFDWSMRGMSACQPMYCIPSRKYLNRSQPGSILVLKMRASMEKEKSKVLPVKNIPINIPWCVYTH